MDRYDIWQNGTKIAHGMLARGTGDRMGIDPTEIAWAVEQHGRCDNELSMTAVISPSTDPGPLTEEMLQSYEY